MCSGGCGRGATRQTTVKGADGRDRVVTRSAAIPIGYEIEHAGRVLRYVTRREAQAAADSFQTGQTPRPVFS